MAKEVLSCYWNVYVNGKELDLFRRECIDSIELQENCGCSDACTIKINDPDFLFIEDNIFVDEATIKVSMGWHGDTHRIVFDGYISAIDISFPENGYPVLSVFCLDETHIMSRKKKKRSWDNVTSAEVIQKIAKEYGFKCVIESGYDFTKEDTISQSDNTDIEFCESLANNERVPFMCKLLDKTLYYVKLGIVKDPSATLYYRKYPYDVVSFSPQINKETIKEEVTSSDINTNDKTTDTHTATSDNTPRDTQGDNVKTSSDPTGKSSRAKVYDPEHKTWEVK